MTSDATPGLAAELEQVRKRMAAAPRTTVAALASAADVPGLVAAVEAVLALHRPDCEMGVEAVWCRSSGHAWPCPTYRAISAALTGEGASDGQ